jgi:tetratricopeptide (TPR) repeat protein
MSDYQLAHLDEIEEVTDGREPWRPVRHHFGITSFGVNTWTAKEAGGRLINEHDEDEPDGHEELYFVARGHATFELDGERRDAPGGTWVYVKPGVKRTAFAEEAGTTLIALGGAPGKAYEVSGWEVWAPVSRLYQEGKYDEAADLGRSMLEADDRYPMLYYNVACCEALAGRKEDALAHLRRSIELSERSREYAKGDTDLDSLRDEPAFRELVGT